MGHIVLLNVEIEKIFLLLGNCIIILIFFRDETSGQDIQTVILT